MDRTQKVRLGYYCQLIIAGLISFIFYLAYPFTVSPYFMYIYNLSIIISGAWILAGLALVIIALSFKLSPLKPLPVAPMFLLALGTANFILFWFAPTIIPFMFLFAISFFTIGGYQQILVVQQRKAKRNAELKEAE